MSVYAGGRRSPRPSRLTPKCRPSGSASRFGPWPPRDGPGSRPSRLEHEAGARRAGRGPRAGSAIFAGSTLMTTLAVGARPSRPRARRVPAPARSVPFRRLGMAAAHFPSSARRTHGQRRRRVAPERERLKPQHRMLHVRSEHDRHRSPVSAERWSQRRPRGHGRGQRRRSGRCPSAARLLVLLAQADDVERHARVRFPGQRSGRRRTTAGISSTRPPKKWREFRGRARRVGFGCGLRRSVLRSALSALVEPEQHARLARRDGVGERAVQRRQPPRSLVEWCLL